MNSSSWVWMMLIELLGIVEFNWSLLHADWSRERFTVEGSHASQKIAEEYKILLSTVEQELRGKTANMTSVFER